MRADRRLARGLVAAGALVLAAGVALGAIASHAAGRAPHPDAARLLQTAVLYQLVHGIALVLAGVLARFGATRWLALAGAAFLRRGGALLRLSLLARLHRRRRRGSRRPSAAPAFIAGWVLLAVHALAGERD